jgi:DNA-binding NtrC family response regulator
MGGPKQVENRHNPNRSDIKMNNGHLSILVVDDDENIREILKDILTISDHQVTLAGNGEEGLELFYRQEFDLVFTDLGMPGISGWELNRRIKESHPDTPVIIISGWGTQLSEEELKKNKADFVIPKPFQLDQIVKATERWGRKRYSEQKMMEAPV